MSGRDVVLEVVGQVAAASSVGRPEAVSVLVIADAPVSSAVAAAVAPLIASRLYPGRAFGAVLHLEPAEKPGSWTADVEVVYSLDQVSIGARAAFPIARS